jgi:hypothetical protein
MRAKTECGMECDQVTVFAVSWQMLNKTMGVMNVLSDKWFTTEECAGKNKDCTKTAGC